MPVPNSEANEFQALQARIDADAKEIEQWWSEPRWNKTKRTYSAREIAIRRGTFLL